jgi:hypothetical protein
MTVEHTHGCRDSKLLVGTLHSQNEGQSPPVHSGKKVTGLLPLPLLLPLPHWTGLDWTTTGLKVN